MSKFRLHQCCLQLILTPLVLVSTWQFPAAAAGQEESGTAAKNERKMRALAPGKVVSGAQIAGDPFIGVITFKVGLYDDQGRLESPQLGILYIGPTGEVRLDHFLFEPSGGGSRMLTWVIGDSYWMAWPLLGQIIEGQITSDPGDVSSKSGRCNQGQFQARTALRWVDLIARQGFSDDVRYQRLNVEADLVNDASVIVTASGETRWRAKLEVNDESDRLIVKETMMNGANWLLSSHRTLPNGRIIPGRISSPSGKLVWEIVSVEPREGSDDAFLAFFDPPVNAEMALQEGVRTLGMTQCQDGVESIRPWVDN